jgi:hypothetical protein
MHQMVWNFSGRVVGMGRTFLLTHLYLKTRVSGSAGGRGRRGCCTMACVSEGGEGGDGGGCEEVQTETILTPGAHPV